MVVRVVPSWRHTGLLPYIVSNDVVLLRSSMRRPGFGVHSTVIAKRAHDLSSHQNFRLVMSATSASNSGPSISGNMSAHGWNLYSGDAVVGSEVILLLSGSVFRALPRAVEVGPVSLRPTTQHLPAPGRAAQGWL